MRAARPQEVARPDETAPGVRERGGSPWLGRRSPPSAALERYLALERALQSLVPGPSSPVAPATGLGAFADWSVHLAMSPAKQWELLGLGVYQWQRFAEAAWQAGWQNPSPAPWCIEPLPQDKRFADPDWREPPFALTAQAFLLCQEWWQRAVTAVPGVTRHHEEMVEFAARQWLDMASPSNTLANPAVLRSTAREGGANLLRGALYATEDAARELSRSPPVGADRYKVGRDIAATPGIVVLRTRLMELIRYEPTTSSVHAEPLLIVPAWIMKYYVLDLEPRNSLIRFLVDAGFTVYAISWKNPTAEDRDMSFDDYDTLGVSAALDHIGRAHSGVRTHALGYCLGGTLLSMTAAALGRRKSEAINTVTLLAAQTDFTEPGELSLFVDESQLAWLEATMARQGYLDSWQMRASFQMIRSRDLIWSYRLGTYLLGERAPVSALMAWNADGTRLPARMHSDYLRALYLDNALARGDYRLHDVPINLDDIRIPMFIVGTVQDHVAPWRSVFKLHQLTNAPKTFVLTAGGHNVGIVNPPGQPRASYRLRQWQPGDRLLTPDEWLAATESVPGSWWTPWVEWLRAHSGERVAPPGPADSLGPAPGSYVLAP